jgi:hypothetical protein
VTDDTAGTGLPDDRTGPDTPGPEATPEQEAYVAGLLASLRADDPEIPDHVAARIDGVLAELRRTEPVAAGGAGALVDSDDAAAGTAAAAVGTDATVLPLPTARRESGTTRTFRWVAGAAAAIVVVAGGAAVIRGTTGSSSSTSGAALSAGDASNGGRTPAPIRSSGTSYSKAELASQATALVASTTTGQEQPEVAPATPDPAQSDQAEQPTARMLLSPATLPACLEQLTGAPGAVPLAIDQGTYEGKPADVVVLPSPDDAARLEVWVIGPGCTRENVEMYEFRTIPAPGSSAGGTPESDAPAPPAAATPEPSTSAP